MVEIIKYKLTKQELVMLDERFIEWLARDNGGYDKLSGQRYLEVTGSREDGCCLNEYNSLDKIEKAFAEEGDTDNWQVEAIFDLKDKKEIKFETATPIKFVK